MAEMANEGDNDDWFRYRYVRQQSTACVFFLDGDNDSHVYFFLHPDADKIPIYPPTVTSLSASTMGLVLSLPYAVFNPFGGEKIIPTPIKYHAQDSPRALIVCSDLNHPGRYLFFIVCVVPSPVSEETYCFDVYTSNTNLWWYDEDEYPLGHVRADTGVSCGTYAYWITDVENEYGETEASIVCYDVSSSRVYYYHLPQNVRNRKAEYRHLQLGTRGQELLMLIASTDVELEVYTFQRQWEHLPDEWVLNFRQRFALGSIVPLKSQSWGRPQVLFWVQDLLHLWESYWDWRKPLGPDPFRLSFPQMMPLSRSLRPSIVPLLPSLRPQMMPLSRSLRPSMVLNPIPHIDFCFDAVEDFPGNSNLSLIAQPIAISTNLGDIGTIPVDKLEPANKRLGL